MTNNLPALLAELSEIAPQICQRKETEFAGTWYKIGDYEFGYDLWVDGEFLADYTNAMVRGLPAYDWLQGALMRVIEGKGWDFRNQKAQGVYFVQLWKNSGHTVPMADSRSFDSLVEAILIALIQAIKGE